MTHGAHTPDPSPSRPSTNPTAQTAGPEPAPGQAMPATLTRRHMEPQLEQAGSRYAELMRLAGDTAIQC